MVNLIANIGGFGVLIVVVGFFLAKFVNKQDVLVAAINQLNLSVTKLTAELEAYKEVSRRLEHNHEKLEKKHEDLDAHVDAIHHRVINLEKDHEAKTKPHDTCR